VNHWLLRPVVLVALPTAGLLALTACPPPLPEPKDPDAFELDASPAPLAGTVVGEPWNVLQSFAMGSEEEGFTLYLSPEPVTACDADTAYEVGVLTVDVESLGLQPWSDTATNRIQLAEGASLSTKGGGIDVDLDPSGANLVGEMIVDVSEDTVLDGQFTVPLCN
jgi:hypothetical protein